MTRRDPLTFLKSLSDKPGPALEEVGGYLKDLVRDWQMIYYEVDEFVAQGERVVMLGNCSWRHRATGKTIESPKADIIRLRHGKIIDFIEFFDTAKVVAATVE